MDRYSRWKVNGEAFAEYSDSYFQTPGETWRAEAADKANQPAENHVVTVLST